VNEASVSQPSFISGAYPCNHSHHCYAEIQLIAAPWQTSPLPMKSERTYQSVKNRHVKNLVSQYMTDSQWDQSASPSPSLPSPLLVIAINWEPGFFFWEAISAFFRNTAPGEGYGRCWNRGPWNIEQCMLRILRLVSTYAHPKLLLSVRIKERFCYSCKEELTYCRSGISCTRLHSLKAYNPVDQQSDKTLVDSFRHSFLLLP